MRKFNEENERIKRKYFRYLREAARQSDASIDKSAAAIIRFEQSTDFKSFKSFHIKQAMEFKKMLKKSKNEKTGQPLSITTISANTRLVKAFFNWLRWEPGFKSRIGQSDAEYFNLSAKEEAVAHAHREKPFPSMEQALHAFRQMPYGSDIEKRNRALFAFLLVTGIRDGALVSLKLKHVDTIEEKVFQDPREVNTKASKTIYTTFFPMEADLIEAVTEWVRYLREDKLFGPEDPLFPKTKVAPSSERKFQAVGLSRAHWATATAIREIVGNAFAAAGIERFGPHSFRKTLVQYGERVCKTPEEFKAWSQNLGHENVLTTFTSYGAVSRQRQAEIIKSLAV
ncbi:site-specific integrase [Hyphococcus formosus]|uniref:tyrosine-type recombinase/integrase n=1 Tax=Hyphococcus formosus TaxID=3143534 RepID=UPI00398A6B0E